MLFSVSDSFFLLNQKFSKYVFSYSGCYWLVLSWFIQGIVMPPNHWPFWVSQWYGDTLKTFPTSVGFIAFVEEKLCKSSHASEVINSKQGATHTQMSRMFTVVGLVSLLNPIPLKPIPWLLSMPSLVYVCQVDTAGEWDQWGWMWGGHSVQFHF